MSNQVSRNEWKLSCWYLLVVLSSIDLWTIFESNLAPTWLLSKWVILLVTWVRHIQTLLKHNHHYSDTPFIGDNEKTPKKVWFIDVFPCYRWLFTGVKMFLACLAHEFSFERLLFKFAHAIRQNVELKSVYSEKLCYESRFTCLPHVIAPFKDRHFRVACNTMEVSLPCMNIAFGSSELFV